jgi:predicted nucleic acid-binding protein
MNTFFDTNVLIAIQDSTHKFHSWANDRFVESKVAGPIIITDIVYAEFCVGMASQENVDKFMSELGLELLRTGWSALFRASKAIRDYRAQGGGKTKLLPDFIIGAHAEVEGAPLVTTDKGSFYKRFSQLVIISPP